jgi:hypothetical protein
MAELNKLIRQSISQNAVAYSDRLAMYDQYGPMAYGIILQIIPQAELAQKVLIDLFVSPQLQMRTDPSPHLACEIIRLARARALEVQLASPSQGVSYATPVSSSTDTSGKRIFDLSFFQGQKPELVAERLKIPCSDVLKAIREYFQYLRAS